MNILTLIKILLEEFQQKLAEVSQSIPRTLVIPEITKKIKVIIGMRRVGKTYSILQKISSLIENKNIDIQQILYLNLEDDRLLPCTQNKLRELIESFYSLYPQNHDRVCYLFFDEIQNVEDWPVLIRRILDTKKVEVFLTGSSAKLLSKEIHTSLRGRAITTEVWPYSFGEYLQALEVQVTGEFLAKKKSDLLLHHLRTYLHEGGFPETVKLSEERRRQILQDYVDVVIMRDIIERYNITHITLIKYMIMFLIKNAGNTFSINKFSNDLKSQGLSSSKNTLYDYLAYIEDAYLTFSVPLYSESIRKTQSNPRKVYAIDSGLVKSYSFGTAKNYGHLFENLLFLDLRRQGHKVYYYLTQERYEVDFLSINPQGKMKLYQVVWDTSDEDTLQRELRALKTAQKETKLEGELITPDTYIELIWSKTLE